MTTLSVVPANSSVLRLLGPSTTALPLGGTWHSRLCKPLCAAGRGPWLSQGLSALEGAVGAKADEGSAGLGLVERRSPFHSPPCRAAAQRTAARGR